MHRQATIDSDGSSEIADNARPSLSRAWSILSLLFLGYIGVYLCRKNLSTATPLLREAFGKSKAEIGTIASLGTLAYGVGKMFFGPVIDRFGGRRCFFVVLGFVALFCGLGGLAPSFTLLTVAYGANRFAGSAGWGSMVKQVPDWFPHRLVARATSILCLSYVIGGAAAAWLAGHIAEASHNNWRAIMGLPAIILVGILLLTWLVLPKTPGTAAPAPVGKRPSVDWMELPKLFTKGPFLVLCALSFTTTLGREFFADWGVDFLKTACNVPVADASRYSSAFDLGGVAGILGVGWLYDRVGLSGLRWLLMAILGLLAGLQFLASTATHFSLLFGVTLLALSGLLLYGPYSLLSGALAIDVQGKDRAATVACAIDSVGYFAGMLAGSGFGWLMDRGGYSRAFLVLGGLMTLATLTAARVSRPAREQVVA
jgi:sugar phosphate permease